MGAKTSQLTFDGAVRLAARVPMLASLLVLSILGVVGQTQWPFVDAALRGAPVASSDDLLNGHRGPVRIVPDVIVPLTPQSPPDALVVVSASDQLVAIDRSVGVSSGAALWGRLRPLTLLERARLPMGSADAGGVSNARPRFILDTGAPSRLHLQVLVAAGALLAAGAALMMIRAVGHAQRPLHSPAGRALARFGDPGVVRQSFDDAMRAEHTASGRLHVTDGFVAFRTRRGFSVFPRNDVIWVRQGVLPEPAFFSVATFPVMLVQAVASNALYVYDRLGKRTRVPLSSRRERHTIVRELESAVPHAIFVDDAPTRRYWHHHRRHFIGAVDERRSLIESYRSNGFAGPEVDVRTAWGLVPDEVDDQLFNEAEEKLKATRSAVPAETDVDLTAPRADGETRAARSTVTVDVSVEGVVSTTIDGGPGPGSRGDGTDGADRITVKRALLDARSQAHTSTLTMRTTSH